MGEGFCSKASCLLCICFLAQAFDLLLQYAAAAICIQKLDVYKNKRQAPLRYLPSV